MAGKRMTSTEIWLRLMNAGDLCGDAMLLAAQNLAQQTNIDDFALAEVGLTVKQASKFLSLKEAELERSLNWLELPDHYLVSADSPLYPPLLRTLMDYPGAFFVKGNISVLNSYQLAVVGSRSPSWYGERWGKIFCEQLATCGFTITSGLACGIDGVAHRAALSVRGQSIAVLGNGLFSIYPRRHISLADQIIDAAGAIVSEFSLVESHYGAHKQNK